MKKFKQKLSLLLVVSMLATLCTTVLVGCDKDQTDNPSETETTQNTESDTSGEVDTSEGNGQAGNEDKNKTNYSVSITTKGGMALSGVDIEIYDGDTAVGYGTTNENGVATVSLTKKNGYTAVVSKLPDGYVAEESKASFLGTNASITVSSDVIKDGTSPSSYKLGDVMHDFTYTTSDGKEITLSESLKEKDMFLLNFWYDGCTWCSYEMPDMSLAYTENIDFMEILALSPQDDNEAIEDYKKTYEGGLSFPMGYDEDRTLVDAFAIAGYPTTVVIDRYGVVCLKVEGYTSYDGFAAIIAWFTGDEYHQQIIEDPSILTPKPKPSDEGIEMPSSDEINSVISPDKGWTYTPYDSEYAWPFVTKDKDGNDIVKGGKPAIMASNSGKNSSYASIYVDIKLEAGQAIAFDYWSSCEEDKDILYVYVDGQLIHEISGRSSQWETEYAYVALNDGTYKLALHYMKDSSGSVGDDTVYINNLRVLNSVDEILEPVHIFRWAATDFNDVGTGYNNYISYVLGNDGYYHVGASDGPLLLASMTTDNVFANDSIYELVVEYSDKFDNDLLDKFVSYSIYAANSSIEGYSTVTYELKKILEVVVETLGQEKGEENQWLQLCAYYDSYGVGVEHISDPIKGLTTFSAYEGKLGANYATYTRVLNPRGYYFKFIPEVSGAYRVTSYSTKDTLISGDYIMTEGMVTDENLSDIHGYEWIEKNPVTDENNTSIYTYMEAGKTYYVNIWYYDYYAYGTIEFHIDYMGETADVFTLASNNYYTMADDENGNLDMFGKPDAGGVDVILGEDGLYYAKNPDGTAGPVLYADFGVAYLFENTILEGIKSGAFDFQKTALDIEIEMYLEQFEQSGTDIETGFIELWQTEDEKSQGNGKSYKYEQRRDLIDDVMNGIYHGIGDRTAEMQEYAEQLITNSDNEELNGCIAVTEELAELLQVFMDTYSLEAEHSWTKLCFFYRHYGPGSNA